MMNFEGVKWYPSCAQRGNVKGLNDPGIETFKGRLVSALAREICQNSIDARNDKTKPVVVEFSSFTAPSCDFPNYDEFSEELLIESKFWKDCNNLQACDFFENVNKKFKGSINWMRISDFNTTGLTGVSQADNLYISTPWKALAKSTGLSEKPDESSMGAFGIGKSAPFACSHFRTVFYATKALGDQGVEEGFAGVARLLSHPTSDGITTGDVFLEKEDGNPYPACVALDPRFVREETGTDIYVPGFVPFDNSTSSWVDEVIVAVLDGFLYAIYNENLVVRINSSEQSVVLDKTYLDEKFGQESFSPEDKFDFTIQQKYQLLTSLETQIFNFEWPGYDGYVEVRFLLGSQDYDRRMTMVRTPGMKIFDKVGFPAKIAFTGMAIVCGEKLNALLKKLENPAHTAWEEERSSEGAKAMKALFKFCRDQLRNLVMTDATEEIDSGLGAILPQEEGEGVKEETDSIIPIIQAVEHGPRKVKIAKDPPKDEEEEEETPVGYKPSEGQGSGGGEHGNTRHKHKTHEKGGHREGDQDGPHEGENNKLVGDEITTHAGKKTQIKILQKRSCCINRKEGKYRFVFTPAKNAKNASLVLYSAAEKDAYPAPLCLAKNLITGEELKVDVATSVIEGLKFKKKTPIELELAFNYSDYLSLEVECYEHH